MKEKFKLPEQAIRLWFWLFAALCLIAAVLMPDHGQMVEGMLRLCTLPYQSANSYFDASGGGFAGTFLNAAVVCAICAAIYSLPGSKPDGVSVLAYFLTAGFCFWGITVLNIWFCFAGVLLACLVRKVNPCTQGNVFLFSTGIAPLMTDLLVRYPGAEAHGVTLFGAVLTLAVCFVIGLVLPAGLTHSPKVHKGYDLYSAAVPMGLLAFFLRAVLYRVLGGTLPDGAGVGAGDGNWTVANLFCFAAFALALVLGLLLGGSFKQYGALLKDTGVGADYGYAYIVIFFLLDLLIVVRQHKYTTLRTKVIVCAYTAVAAAMIGLQYRYREILCTSVSNTVVLIMLYLQIQNPVVFLDTTTGIGNGTAFESQLEDRLLRKGEGYVLTIHLSKFYHIHTILGTENSNELLREIGAYLYDLCGKFHVFHTAGDAFTVFADTKEQCERLKCEIQKRFESDWVVQENRIALDMEMVVQHYPTDFKAMAEYYGMREFLLENAGKSGAQVIVEADGI